MPSDLSSEFKRQSFHDGRSSEKSGKSRVRKNILRRRSSGGPEMFASSNVEPYGDGMTGQRWRREVLARRTAEQVLVRRRGSLPVEVLAAATHSGVYRKSYLSPTSAGTMDGRTVLVRSKGSLPVEVLAAAAHSGVYRQ